MVCRSFEQPAGLAGDLAHRIPVLRLMQTLAIYRVPFALMTRHLPGSAYRPTDLHGRRVGALLLTVVALAACGGGSGGSSAEVPPSGSNQAPTIRGVPPSVVTATAAYYFAPIASDADGDALSFEIVGRPAWASFDTSSGTLSGTPGTTAIGTYSNIQIFVSDGQAQAALPVFIITVEPPRPGSATLVWQKPTKNVDGSELTDLAGYVVRYGTDPARLDQTLGLADPELTTIVVEDLAVGTWYFTIASRNASGAESDPTGSVFLEIR